MSTLNRLMRRIDAWIDHVSHELAGWFAAGWRVHLERVASSPGYAAATAAVLAGGLGLMKPRDVIAAVLAGLLGVYVRGTRDAGGALPGRYDGY